VRGSLLRGSLLMGQTALLAREDSRLGAVPSHRLAYPVQSLRGPLHELVEARMFSSRLSLSVLIELCRVLRHYLGAGLSLPEVFRQQERRGPAYFRADAGGIAARLEQGDSLEAAIKPVAYRFPPIFLSMSSVGERTGMLPEVFSELERFFLHQQKLRRTFIARITWPVTQFILAVLVLAGLIWIMGQLSPQTPTGQRFDPLGLGLFGTSGALIFLGVIFGTIGGIGALYWFASRSLGGRATVDRMLLNLPAIGPCLSALALGRFCLALRLTTESGMSIRKALRLSLRATGNSAFESGIDTVEKTVEAGDDITLALGRTGVFPDDLLRIVAVAEESGQLSEVMRHQGDHYHEEATRRLATLTSIAGYGVYAMIGLFIIVAIFRIYGSYLNMLNSI
jgi:type IV pilus assembly protein PilC